MEMRVAGSVYRKVFICGRSFVWETIRMKVNNGSLLL